MSSKPDSAKKQTFHVIIAFIIGILVTRYFFDKKTQKEQNIEIVDEVDEKVIEKVAQEQPLIKKEYSLQNTTSENQFKAAQQKVPTQTSELIHEKENPIPRRIELTLDEHTVGNLERNINDLSIKVTMRRENQGWRVNYITSDNLMASTGIQNNDLVLYELIETAKSDPINRSLVTRLENIFSTLER